MSRENKNRSSRPLPVHGHCHGHHHGVGSDGDSYSRIRLAFLLNFSFAIIELIGGLWINSMAILSDALHDLGDSLALAGTLFLEKISNRSRDRSFSYGYRRFSLLAAIINGVIILGGSILILVYAIPRLWEPQATQPAAMIGLALLGVIINGIGMLRLRKGSSHNEQMISWHLLEDVLGWIAILIGGIFMYFFDLPMIDPLLAIFFTLFTIYNVGKIFRASLNIFLQGIPAEIDEHELEQRLTELPGIQSVHDTHIWSMDGAYHILTTHLVYARKTTAARISKLKQEARRIIGEYNIEHATIEMESEDECCELKNC